MRKQCGWVLCLALAAWAGPAFAGGKVVDATKGAEIKGNVSADDPKVNLDLMGKLLPFTAKEFAVKMEGGKGYTISMNSSDAGFDPLLIVQDKDGKQLAFDDDGGGGLNSLVKFTPSATGTYKVFAASLNGAAGAFELKFTAGGAGKVGDGKAIDVGKGVELKGQIKGDEPKARVTDGPKSADLPAQLFTLKLEAGKSYKIAMNAVDRMLDTFLILQDDAGKQLAYDDDGGMGLNSLLSFTAPKTGTYKLYAASLSGTGQFTLRIDAAAAGGDGKEMEVGKGLRLTGTLNAGTKEVIYLVKMQAGKSYRIDHMSGNFDCWLEVRSPEGKVLAEDDDGGEGLNSRIIFRAPANGTYRVVATSLGRSGMGDFITEVREE